MAEEKEVKKKDLYHRAVDFFKKSIGLVTVISTMFTGIVWGVTLYYHEEISTFWNTVDYVDEMNNVTIPELENQIESLETDIQKINTWIIRKGKSHAIGLRVHEDGDLWYRHTDLKEYRALYDVGEDNFYFYDSNGERQECH